MTVELDATGNLILDKYGNADTLSGIEEEKQILRNAMLIFRGSWFEDLTIGPDWLTILEKGFTVNQIKAEIRRVLTELDIVTSIINISLGNVDQDRRTELTFVVTTTSGATITFSEVL